MIATPQFNKRLTELYGTDDAILAKQTSRYHAPMQEFPHRFQPSTIHFFSTLGRAKIGGNHTDHHHGKVLAASINLNSIAIAAPTADNRIAIYSVRHRCD